jgi:pimeloyl-ACP methyl ester carboxylesterase
MVHGNPTWSFLYRNIARELVSDGHRVVLPDHLGMGMSDVPSTSEFDYRPRSHARHLNELVVALDLDNVTLVVQDWGGPIGLDMATRQPDRIAGILIMNTWAWSIDADDPGEYHGLIDWYNQATQMAQVMPDFFCAMALPGQAAIMAAEADPTEGEVYDAVLAAYVSPAIDPVTGEYRTDEPCAPMQIFAESIVDDDAFQGEVETRLSALAGTPYALLFGLSDILFGALRCDADGSAPCPGTSTCTCDPVLLPSRVEADCATASADFHVCLEPDGSSLQPYADRFVELLGEDSLVMREVVPESDHMVQEDAPERVVEAIRALVAAAD